MHRKDVRGEKGTVRETDLSKVSRNLRVSVVVKETCLRDGASPSKG